MDEALEQGRGAVAASRWGDAYRAFAAVDADTLDVDDLDRLGTAAYMTGHDEHGYSAWTRAHQRCVEEGSVHRAASFGAKLGQTLGFKGDWPRASGWVERVGNLLSEADIDCVERGYLELGQGMCRLFEHGDIPAAHDLFVRAGKTAARFHDRDLRTMARITEGRMNIYLGEPTRGVALLDEAAIAVETGELSALMTGDAYCTLIDAVWELSDLTRARAWTATFSDWCAAQQDLVLYHGNCLLHRAEVTCELGDWTTARDQARAAVALVAEPVNMMMIGGAHAFEGDIHRLCGAHAEAEAAYERANAVGTQPQPGLALLRLAEGRPDTAAAMIQRVLTESENPVARSHVLPAATQIALAAGDHDLASAYADELRGIATELGTPLLRARAAHANGAVLLAVGAAGAALGELRSAFSTCTEIGARHEAARVRLLLADACRALGDTDTAGMEAATATAAFAEFVGAAPESAAAPDGLTDRETEVLRLLAQGHTNRVIAERLFISEKTVSSHVSHIFTKIGVTSRAAATAYAYERGLAG